MDATTQSDSRQLPVLGSDDSINPHVTCKTCGESDLEEAVHWVACDRCKLWEHKECAGIDASRRRTSKYCCSTCKRQQWTPSDSKKMWDYIEKTGDVVIGTVDHSGWFKNMKKEIGGPFSDATFRRHLDEEMTKYISDGTNDSKQRIKYAMLSKISCSPGVVNEFQSHGDVAFNLKKQVLAFTERGSTEPLFAVKNWKKKSSTVDPVRQNLPGPITQSAKDRFMELVEEAIPRPAEKNQGEEGEDEDEEEKEDEEGEEEEEEILQSEEIVSNFFNDALAVASRNEVDDAAPTSPARRSVSPRATERSPLRELSVDHPVDDFIDDAIPSETEGNNLELSNSATNMSTEELKAGWMEKPLFDSRAKGKWAKIYSMNDQKNHPTVLFNAQQNKLSDQQAPVATIGGTAIVHRGQELDTSIFQEVPQATTPVETDQIHFSSNVEVRVKTENVEEVLPSHSAPINVENIQATQTFGAKRAQHIKTEGEPVPAKRARADALKQSRLASSNPSGSPPDTMVGSYLLELVLFLKRLNLLNEKLDEFIEVMLNIVGRSNTLKLKVSYFKVHSWMRDLLDTFKYNSGTFEDMDTADITCCYDETYYLGLKNFLVSFKTFVSNFGRILPEFGQLGKDIEDEIQRCEEEEKGGKQKLLKIEGIIDQVASDFNRFGLMKEYKAEVEKRKAAEESCSSNSH